MHIADPSKNVFINCPFDPAYRRMFQAIVFAVRDLGFFPRCALESDNAADLRFTKICALIRSCSFGINDLSYVRVDPRTRLPRFNMPLELGLFLGCAVFGRKAHSRKNCLILDRDRYRYLKFISDLNGQDIHAHQGQPHRAVQEVRDWLVSASKLSRVPDGKVIWNRYQRFQKAMPKICKRLGKHPSRLVFVEYVDIIDQWLFLHS